MMPILKRRPVQIAIAVVISVVLLVVSVYFLIATSDAYKAFDDWCMSSKSVRELVGQVSETELVIKGKTAFVRDQGDAGFAAFRVKITGSEKSVLADVNLKKIDDKWQVVRVSVNDRPLEIR
jgi:hypothetical protein